jgi:hypothetical protein
MSRRRLSHVALLAVSMTAALSFGACSRPEDAILTHFFTAARLRDNTTLGSFATADFDPRTHGIITTFTITNVSPEQRTPLALRTLAKAHEDARAADAEFTKRKQTYQDENIEAIERVVKAGREAKLKGKDAEVQVAWYRFVDEGAEVGRKLSETRRRLAAESDIVELSVVEPGKLMDVTKYDGELVTKEVTISAPVRLPDGQTVTKTLVVRLQHAELKGDKPIVGRWIVENIKEATTPGGAKSS